MPGLIYLDYNGTTPVDPRVGEAVQPFLAGGLEGAFANPSSAYAPAAGTKGALAAARASVAALLGCEAGDVLFCSGGTESINHVVKGVVMEAWKRLGRGSGAAAAKTAATSDGAAPRRPHVIISAVEHVAVLNAVAWCCDPGAVIPGASAAAAACGMGFCDVTVVPVGKNGVVAVADVVAAVTPATVLVSIMLANNETGAVQPVAEIARALASAFPARRAFASGDAPAAADAPLPLMLHSDASQCLGKLPVPVRDLGCDFCTVAGHKLYAPKGCGATYVRAAAKPLLPVFMHGAGQEGGMRAGTENLALCAALGAGAALCKEHEGTEPARLAGLRNRLAAAITRGCREAGLPAPIVHGPLAAELATSATGTPSAGFTSLPNTLSIALPGSFAAAVVLELKETVAISAGAACHASAVTDPRRAHVSHVLAAMSIPSCIALCTLRLSLGRWSTAEEVDAAATAIVAAAARVRASDSGRILAAIAESEGCAHAYAVPVAGAAAGGAAAVGGAGSTPVAAPAPASSGAARLQTDHVFLADTHQYETSAAVLAVLPVDAAGAQLIGADGASRPVGPPVAGTMFAVITSATVAHPQGGGQPADRGIIALDSADAEAPVFVFTSVRLSSGLEWDTTSPSPVAGAAVLHYGSFVPRAALGLGSGASADDLAAAADSIGEKGVPGASAAAPWSSAPAAAAAAVHINRPHRRLCARLHSGGHILDLAVKMAYDKWDSEHPGTSVERLVPGKGYHFADGPNVEYEGSVPPEMREWLVAEINARVAALIAAGTPTAVVSVPQDVDALAVYGLGPSDCAHLPPGRAVRVVMVGGITNPCPCGGTHVQDAAELRALTATKIVVKKGRTKVSYTVAP